MIAAMNSTSKEKSDTFMALAESAAKRGVEVKHPILKKLTPVVRMKPEQFYSLKSKYTNPMSHAAQGASPVDLELMKGRLEQYNSNGQNPYDSLLPGDELDTEDVNENNDN